MSSMDNVRKWDNISNTIGLIVVLVLFLTVAYIVYAYNGARQVWGDATSLYQVIKYVMPDIITFVGPALFLLGGAYMWSRMKRNSALELLKYQK